MRYTGFANKAKIVIKTRNGLTAITQNVELSAFRNIASDAVTVNIAGEAVVGAVRAKGRRLAGSD